MPRSVKEWIGRNDNAMPPQTVFDRLWAKQDGKDALTGLPFTAADKIARDHIVPLIDGGENRETNLQLITAERHKVKTAQEATDRSEVRAVRGKHRGYQRKPSRMRGPRFPKPQPQRAATRKTQKWSLLP